MALNDRGRQSSGSEEFAEIEQMLRQIRSKVPRVGGGAWILVLAVIVIWLFTGFYTVAPDQVAIVLRFGKMVRVADPGPHLRLPWPIETIEKIPVTEVQRLEVGFRTISPGPPPEYEEMPEEAHMLTGDENIVSLEFIVQYQVKRAEDGSYAVQDYQFNLKRTRTPEGKNATVKEVAEAAMREVVGRHTIDSVLTEGKQEVQQECQNLIQKILDSYGAGIEVTAVNLQDVQPPTKEVSNAFKDVASAREDKVRSLQEAEGYRNDLLPKARGEAEAMKAAAEGYAQARVAEATGQASRFLSILKEYRLARDVTRDRIYLETLEAVLSTSEKIIVDSKSAEQVVPYLPLRGEMPRPSTRTQP